MDEKVSDIEVIEDEVALKKSQSCNDADGQKKLLKETVGIAVGEISADQVKE